MLNGGKSAGNLHPHRRDVPRIKEIGESSSPLPGTRFHLIINILRAFLTLFVDPTRTRSSAAHYREDSGTEVVPEREFEFWKHSS
jgi:hypothetical protein